MNESLPFYVGICAALALIFAFMALFVANGIKRGQIAAAARLKEQAEKIRDVKAVTDRVDNEFLKKILLRLNSNETDLKKLGDLQDLADEKLRSYINRQNARLPRPRGKDDDRPGPIDPRQQSLIDELEAKGLATPLAETGPPNGRPLKLVRRSLAG